MKLITVICDRDAVCLCGTIRGLKQHLYITKPLGTMFCWAGVCSLLTEVLRPSLHHLSTFRLSRVLEPPTQVRFSSSSDEFARCGTCCRRSAAFPPSAQWAVGMPEIIQASLTWNMKSSAKRLILTFVPKYWRWSFSLKGDSLVIWNLSRFDFIFITWQNKKQEWASSFVNVKVTFLSLNRANCASKSGRLGNMQMVLT